MRAELAGYAEKNPNVKKHIEHPIFKIIAHEAAAMDAEAYVVGGYVRDIFLKRESKDIDIVVTGSGEPQIEQIVHRHFAAPFCHGNHNAVRFRTVDGVNDVFGMTEAGYQVRLDCLLGQISNRLDSKLRTIAELA